MPDTTPHNLTTVDPDVLRQIAPRMPTNARYAAFDAALAWSRSNKIIWTEDEGFRVEPSAALVRALDRLCTELGLQTPTETMRYATAAALQALDRDEPDQEPAT